MSDTSVDRLALLGRVSQVFNSSLDLNEVLNTVMDEVIAITRAERGFVMLKDEEDCLICRAARGLDQKDIKGSDFHISRSVVNQVVKDGQPLLTSNAQLDNRLDNRASVHILGLLSILCVPLQVKGNTLGAIYVDNRLQTGVFTREDMELLATISSSAAIAIENARLYQVAIDKGRLERELQLAREVQASLIPSSTPQIPGWEFAATWHPAREVSGDYYDFITSHPKQPGLVIADVSDKGTPAALFMALTRSVVRATLSHSVSPAEGITQANKLICADSTGSMFVTLFYARLDTHTGEATYVNAGHNPPLLVRASKEALIELTRTGMALGVDDSLPYKQQVVRLDPGDLLLLYTDGITDAISDNGQEFGLERLKKLLEDQRGASASEVVAALEKVVKTHTGDSAPFDDITIVVVKRI